MEIGQGTFLQAISVRHSGYNSHSGPVYLPFEVMDQNTDRGRFDPTKHKPIPSVIDAIAAETPERPFLSIPNEDHKYSSWRDISYGSFARAVDRCAWWLKEKLGESQSFETLSYIGPQDATCLIFLLASVKTGHNVGTMERSRFPDAAGD